MIMVETHQNFILVQHPIGHAELNDKIICFFNRNIGTYQNKPFCAAYTGTSYHNFIFACALLMQLFMFVFNVYT